jgi:AraC family transcriptional regulator
MKKVFKYGRFHGVVKTHLDTELYSFSNLEDSPSEDVPVHTHESAHFFFILNGNFQATVNRREQKCSSMTMLYYPAGTTHSDKFHSPEGQFLTISLSPKSKVWDSDDVSLLDYAMKFGDNELSFLGSKIYQELNNIDDFSSIVLESMTNELLVHTIRNTRNSKHFPKWLNLAFEILNDRFDEDITVSEIALTIGVHPVHLARTFRKYFGSSPGEYLRTLRIEFASNLLLNSNLPLVEVSLRSGFSNQSYFTSSFRKVRGMTPNKFRKIYSSCQKK